MSYPASTPRVPTEAVLYKNVESGLSLANALLQRKGVAQSDFERCGNVDGRWFHATAPYVDVADTAAR